MRALLFFFFALTASVGRTSDFKAIRVLASQQQTDEAVRLLKLKTDPKLDAETRTLAWFGMGVILSEAGRDSEAQSAMEEALKLGTRLADFANYIIGLSLKNQGKNKEAKSAFHKVMGLRPPSQRDLDARFAMGEIALLEKDHREARHFFGYLERKTRRTPRYASVVLNLIRSEMGLRNSRGVCQWVRKLYTKNPGDPEVLEWGVDLHKVELDGKKPGCMAAPNDFKTRIRNLQLSGHSDKAKSEIELLKTRSKVWTKSYVDSLYAGFLIQEGSVEEAFNILVPYWENYSRDFAYLMLLGKAATRSGHYAIAAGAFNKAYQMTPRSRKGREALFQAALISYQNGDLDGAAQRFAEFRKKFASSGFSRDSLWYLAWIQYSKQDFLGAYEKFSELGKMRRRRRNSFTSDRVDYWRAMSLMKAGQLEQAKALFQDVSADRLFGYYALAAQARLEELKLENKPVGLAAGPRTPQSVSPLRTGGFRTLSDALVPSEPLPSTEAETGEAEVTVAPKSEEEEGENALAASEAAEEEAEKPEDASAGATIDGVAETIADIEAKTSFKDPRLQDRFLRASELHVLGLKDWARWELWEIERRTRNRDYLKKLMAEYELAGAYHRSSSIAQVEFGMQRSRQGFEAARGLWQSAYPKAYDAQVSSNSKAFQVPHELIWSIMRAESRYKPDVVSPVGAMGLMQLMPYTAVKVAQMVEHSNFQFRQLMDPEVNIKLGARYLSRLNQQLGGQIPLIAAAYNAGPHRVAAWIRSFGKMEMDEFVEHIPFFETRNYVKKVVHNYYVYSHLYSKDGGKPLAWLTQPPGVAFDGPLPTRESWD